MYLTELDNDSVSQSWPVPAISPDTILGAELIAAQELLRQEEREHHSRLSMCLQGKVIWLRSLYCTIRAFWNIQYSD
jgi:hypothetical protein